MLWEGLSEPDLTVELSCVMDRLLELVPLQIVAAYIEVKEKEAPQLGFQVVAQISLALGMSRLEGWEFLGSQCLPRFPCVRRCVLDGGDVMDQP